MNDNNVSLKDRTGNPKTRMEPTNGSQTQERKLRSGKSHSATDNPKTHPENWADRMGGYTHLVGSH